MVSGKDWLSFLPKLAGNAVADFPSYMMAPLGAYQRYHTCAWLPDQLTPLALLTLIVGQYAFAGQDGGGEPRSLRGASASARFRLPPLVPSALFAVPEYGSCSGTPAAVFSVIAAGNASSVGSLGLFRVNPARWVVLPVLFTVTVTAGVTPTSPLESVIAAVTWWVPL